MSVVNIFCEQCSIHENLSLFGAAALTTTTSHEPVDLFSMVVIMYSSCTY